MQTKAVVAWTAGEVGYAVRHPRLPRTWPARVAATVVVLAVLAGAAGVTWHQLTKLPSDAALAVGDRVVTVAQLDERVQTLRAMYGVQVPVQDPAKLDRFRRDAAKAVAITMVLQDRATAMDVAVADPKVRQALDAYITQRFGPGPAGHSAFVTALGNVGTSEPAVLDEVRSQMSVSELFTAVTEDVTTTDKDLQAAWPQYADRLGVPEKRTLRNIVVTNKDRAQKIMAQVQGGARFADVARTTSIDNSTRPNGGELGQVSAQQLLPDYANAAFAAPVGGLYGPLQNQYGWNVGQVVAVAPGRPAQFDQVKDKLRQVVDFDRRMQAWSDWMGAAIRDGEVRYADAYLPADPDAVPNGANLPALTGPAAGPAAGPAPGAQPR